MAEFKFIDLATVDAQIAAAVSALSANSMGVCVHGADDSTPRPTGHAVVTWIGSVAPTNALNNDIWEQTI